MRTEKKKIYELEGFRSFEELYFSWWLEDCIVSGLISSYFYEKEIFELAPKFTYQYKQHLKTKTNIKEGALLRAKSYTPDFKIHFTDAAIGLLTNGADLRSHFYSENHIARIDVKGHYDPNDEHRRFRIMQSWLYSAKRVYVQMVKIVNNKKAKNCFFEKTFTPERYFTTDLSGRKRKLNYRARTVQEFILKIGR